MILLLILLLLQTQIVLHDFMPICFVLDCSDEVLEAANVDLIVQDALQVFKVYFFGKHCL